MPRTGITQSDQKLSPAVTIRSFDEEMREQVSRLYVQVFGQARGQAFDARWRWSQEANLFPKQTPRWVLLDGESVVGYLGTMPLPYLVRNERVIALTPCDYMVHPRYRFHGIKLMKEFFRSPLDCVTCDDMPPTIKITKWLGARQVGILSRHVRILDARALRERPGWSRIPGPLLRVATLGLRLARRVRKARLAPGLAVRAARDFDERFERYSADIARVAPITLARDLRFLEWRYGPGSPHAGREIGVLEGRDGRMAGYVIFAYSGQSHRGAILDLQVLPPSDAATAAALLDFAVSRLRRQGAWMVSAHHLASPVAFPVEALRAQGFVVRGGHKVLVRFREERVAAIAEYPESWNLSYGDTEASHSFA